MATFAHIQLPGPLVVAIVANEASNAGERDYYLSVMDELAYQQPNIASLKTGVAYDDSREMHTIFNHGRNNQEYADINGFSPDALRNLVGDIGHQLTEATIVGFGHSTLQDMLAAEDVLRQSGLATRSAYVTHQVDADAVSTLAAQNTTCIFAPMGEAQAQNLAAQGLNVEVLDAVPHTNTLASCQLHADLFAGTPNGQALRAWQERGEDYALVVINAGFGIKTSYADQPVHHPYTDNEAIIDGCALADLLPANTNVLLMHGGPRNLVDEKHGETPMDHFAAGLRHGGLRGQVLTERFTAGLPYNVIKAAYVAARSPLCRAFVSNAEGYGTMDGAVLHVDNQQAILGMFNFNANQHENARIANTLRYHQRGIALLGMDDNSRGFIDPHDNQQTTPISSRNAAAQIAGFIMRG